MAAQEHRPRRPDAHGLERGARRGAAPRRRRGTPARPGRRARGRRPRRRAARHAGTSAAERGEERPRLDPRLLDLGLGLGVPDDAAADPEVDRGPRRPRACGSSARARSRRSAAAMPSAPIEAPRPTGSSAAIRSSAAIFGAPVTEPPGKVAARISPSAASGAQRAPRRVETRCVTPGELPLRHQLRPADRPGLADTREVVALEVDDHHVLGGVLLALDVHPGRPRALDRLGHEPAPAAGEEELGRGRDDRPARRRRAAAAAAGEAARARRRAPAGSPSNGAERCWTRFTW